MKTVITKPDFYEWERVFKILPVRTEDGYRVMCGHVWRRKYENLLGQIGYTYHTNPDNLENDYNRKKSRASQLTRRKHGGQPLTEGRMRHGSNPKPPVKRPKRPPPPPAPPRPTDSGPGSICSIAVGHTATTDGRTMAGNIAIEPKEQEIKIGDKFKRRFNKGN